MASRRLPSTTYGRVSQVERVVEEQQLRIRDLHDENAYLQQEINELSAKISTFDRTGQKVRNVRPRADGSIRGRVVK